MVVYEILTGIAPHCEGRGGLRLRQVEGEIPVRPHGMLGDPVRPHGMLGDRVWGLLEKCWSRTLKERPSIVEMFHTLKSGPKVKHTPWSLSAVEGSPGTLRLHVQSIIFSEDQPRQQQFYVKFNYGDRDYTTSPTNLKNDWGAHTWSSPESWVIGTDEQDRGHSVSVEVLKRTGPLKRVYTTGEFSLIGSANKHILLTLEKAVIKILMTAIAP